MTEHEVAEFVGLQYVKNGRGPDEFDCWGLLVYIENKFFNVNLPEVDLDNPAACLMLFTENVQAGEWVAIEPHEAVNGDGVLLRGGTQPHVGIYLFGGVLHSNEGVGVTFTRVTELPFHGFGRVAFYRLHK